MAAGAAHPNYHIETYNFLLFPLIQVKELAWCFDSQESSLLEIVSFVRDSLKKETYFETDQDGKPTGEPIPTLTEEWIVSGTESWEHLSAFNFNENGLVIYFSPYQVGPFAVGSFFVEVPYEFIAKHLKTEIKHALNVYWY
jgi:Protein of unknown function (DUF3298)